MGFDRIKKARCFPGHHTMQCNPPNLLVSTPNFFSFFPFILFILLTSYYEDQLLLMTSLKSQFTQNAKNLHNSGLDSCKVAAWLAGLLKARQQPAPARVRTFGHRPESRSASPIAFKWLLVVCGSVLKILKFRKFNTDVFCQ